MTNSEISKEVKKWLKSCTRKGKIARNTIAAGLVVLDTLLSKSPVQKSDVLTKGGELKGARSGLPQLLAKYGIAGLLKEVTTRQGGPDAQRLFEKMRYGKIFSGMSNSERKRAIETGIEVLLEEARRWMSRQQIKVTCERQSAPATWIGSILRNAKGKSGGIVEQHLIGAKLVRQYPKEKIPNYPGHAGDTQTGRPGDFCLGSSCYHVTAAPGRGVLSKCGENLQVGLHPILLVPRDEFGKASHLAEDEGIRDRITLVAIEDFIATNIIEMSAGQQKAFLQHLKALIETYNQRLEQVETDMSLKIDLR